MRKRLTYATSLLFAVGLLSGCQNSMLSSQTDKLTVVTSFYPIYAMTKAVVGETQEVRMIHSNQGIHGFDPSATDVAAIFDSDVFIYHSPTLESWVGDLTPELKNEPVMVLEASKDLKLDKVSGLEDMPIGKGISEASLYDPHTWTDPILASEEVMTIAKTMAEIDSENADLYMRNAREFSKEAQALTVAYQDKFSSCKGKTFVTQHTAFSYLAKRFGLRQLGISGISNEQEPTPRQLSEIEDFVKEYNVSTIFTEENVSPKAAETVAKATGARIETLSPMEVAPEQGRDYLNQLEKNLEVLYRALKF